MEHGKPELDVEDYMARVGVDMLHPGGMERTEELARMCSISDDSRVLDVGCGFGRTARYLAANIGCHVTGIDISHDMIKAGTERIRKEKVTDRVELRVMPVEDMDFPDESFDVAISEGTMVLVDKETAMNQMVRVCRVGGRIGLNELSWMRPPPQVLVDKALEDLHGTSPLTFQGWTELMRGAGLESIEERRYEYKSTSFNILSSIGVRSLLRVTERYLLDQELRHWITKQERLFRDYSEYWGYGLFAGRKP